MLHNGPLMQSRQSSIQEYVHEVILAEDGSSDNSLVVCTALAEANPKVKLFRHPDGKNRGAGATRNLGVLNAQCDLIAFLDADDIYLPKRFNQPVSVLRRVMRLEISLRRKVFGPGSF